MRLLPSLFACTMALATLAPRDATAATDIDGISAAASAIEANADVRGKPAEKALLGMFTKMVWNNAKEIGAQQGITNPAHLSERSFKTHVLKAIGAEVKAAANVSDKTKRMDAWYSLLRTASAMSTAEKVLADWLDFSEPRAYLAKQDRGGPPRVLTQVSTRSSDPRLSVAEEAITLAGELGGAGEGNGVLDAGEWVNLGLAIQNDDRRAFFSSSAWVESGHSCAWVPASVEIEMAELPGKPPPSPEDEGKEVAAPTQALSTWVYLSDTCVDGAQVPLKVRIFDTHRATTTPVVLSVNMTVRNRMGRVYDLVVDTDVPGASDGVGRRTFGAERDFELSHGFTASSAQLLSARAAWALHSDYTPLFSEQSPAPEPLFYAARGTFLADQDFDLHMIDGDDYDKVLQKIADDLEWDNTDEARLWFATDTEVLFETPDPPVTKVKPKPPEICNNYLDDDEDGKHDCQDSECKDEDVCNPIGPLAFSAVQALFSDAMSLEANPAKPTLPNAVKAVEPGYELVFDGNLKGEYQCLVQDLKIATCKTCSVYGLSLGDCKDCTVKKVPLSECGRCASYGLTLDECKACLDAKTPLDQCKQDAPKDKKDKSNRDPAVSYTYRHYFTFPVDWTPSESADFANCEDERDNDLDGLIDALDPDCPQPEVIEGREQVCDDGQDNDGDGLTDCDDDDCPTARRESGRTCDDGRDNDCDGLVDGEDPDCQTTPRLHRIDLGGAAQPIATGDLTGDTTMSWDIEVGVLADFHLRYVYAPNLEAKIRYLVSFARSPSYPVINGAENTLTRTSIGTGIGLHFGETLAVEPRFLVKQNVLSLAPEEGGDSPRFHTDVTTIGMELGVDLFFDLGEAGGWGLYAGGGLSPMEPVLSEGTTVLEHSPFFGSGGLSFSPR